jgi:MFS family permease
MQLAFPCASLCMMYALEKFGRKPTSIVSFLLAGAFAVAFANANSDNMLLAVGFCMIFFIQIAGNSMQIFASEVFPTNARASGFGLAQGAGRLGAAFILPAFLWVQTGYGTGTVFACIAALLLIAVHREAAGAGVPRRVAGCIGAADGLKPTPPFCHCEERSDEASPGRVRTIRGIASLRSQ